MDSASFQEDQHHNAACLHAIADKSCTTENYSEDISTPADQPAFDMQPVDDSDSM
jgi:hypothetical protein